jgi:glucokinase
VPGEGIVTVAVNLDWHDVPLRAELERRLGVPVVVDNDVRVAVLGEHAVGAGRGTRNLVGIWPGTGIGGGVILDGQILTGVNNAAGEIGHMTIKAGGPRCACGARGHLESLASRSAVTRDIAQRVKKGQKTALTQIVGGDVANATSSDLADAYRQGDKLVIKVANRAAKYLAIGIASVANVLNPEMVILGGGLTEALGEPFVHQVQKELEGRPMLAATQSLKVVKSELGDDAGVVGAALLARRRAMAGRNGLVEQRDEPRSVSAPTE